MKWLRRTPKVNKNPDVSQMMLEDYLNNYDKDSIAGALASLQDGFAWKVFSAFLRQKQREFEVAALDLSCQDGNTLRGAKASGIACALEEVANKLIPQFVDYLHGHSGVVEDPRVVD